MSNIVTQSKAARFISVLLIALLIVTALPVNMWQVHAASESTITTDKTAYAKGDPVYVTATSNVDGAWVALSKATSNANDYWVYYYISAANGEAFNIFDGTVYGGYWNSGYLDCSDLEDGSYRVAVLEDKDGTVVGAETFFTIETSSSSDSTLDLEKESYTEGETVKVKATSFATDYPWVGLYEGTEKGSKSLKYYYTSGRNGLWYDLGVLPAGDYTVILFNDYDGNSIAKEVDFTVKESEVEIDYFSTNKTHYDIDEPIIVTANYEYGDKDWVGLYKKGEVAGDALSFKYDYFKSYEGSFDIYKSIYAGEPARTDFTPGEYTLILCANDGYGVLDTVDITIGHTYGEWKFDGADKKTHTRTCDGVLAAEHPETEPCNFDMVDVDGGVQYTCSVCKGTFIETHHYEYTCNGDKTHSAKCTDEGCNKEFTEDCTIVSRTIDSSNGKGDVKVELGCSVCKGTTVVPLIETDSETYDLGVPINVTVNYEVGTKDWVALYDRDGIPGDADSYYYYYPTTGSTENIYDGTGQHPVTKTGEYRLYVLANDGYDVIAYKDIKIEHKYGEWVFNKEDKTHTRTCATHTAPAIDGDTTYTETKSCNFGEGVEVDGIITYTCTVCEGTYTDTHHYEYTCNENKTHTAKCTDGDCDKEFTEPCTITSRVIDDSNGKGDVKVELGCSVCKGTTVVPLIETDSETYDLGVPINVTVNYEVGTKDWVGLFDGNATPADGGPQSYYYYYPTTGSTTNIYDGIGQHPVMKTGDYRLYVLADNGYDVIAYKDITIEHKYGDWEFNEEDRTHTRKCTVHNAPVTDQDTTLIQTEPCTFDEGVEENGLMKFTCTVCNGSYVEAHDFEYVQNTENKTHTKTCKKHDNCSANVTEDCTFVKGYDDVGGIIYTCRWCKQFYEVQLLSTDKKVYDFDEPIMVTVEDYAAKDWVGLYKKGETPNSAGPVSFYYDYPSSKGKTFNIYEAGWNQTPDRGDSIVPGEYTIFLCANDGYTVIESVDITIKHDGEWVYNGYNKETLTGSHTLTCSNTNHAPVTETCTWDEGKKVDNGVEYTCTVCSGTYVETHTYAYTFDKESKTHLKKCTDADCDVEVTEDCTFEMAYEDGNVVYTCEVCKGSYEVPMLSSDKDSYILDEPINVTAFSDARDAWVGLYKKGDTPDPDAGGVVSFYWYNVKDANGTPVNIYEQTSGGREDSFESGEYSLILFGDGSYYNILATKDIYIDSETSTSSYELDINGKKVVTDDSVTVAEGEDVVLTVTGEGTTEKAWVAYYEGKVGASSNLKDQSVGWMWFTDLEDGEWNIGKLTKGDYTVIVYGNEGYGSKRIIAYVTVEGEKSYEKVLEEPTCTRPGLKEVLYVGATEPEYIEIPMLGHDIELVYDKDAKTHSGECKRCDYVADKEPCEFDEGVVTDGIKTFTCKECKGQYTEAAEAPLPPYSEKDDRVAGTDRFKTALQTAEQLKATTGVEKFENIIIANGMDYADALSGTYLAKVKNAPILLINPANANVMKEIADYANANLAEDGTIYILGGEKAVPAKFNTYLDSEKVKIARLAGKDRYATNLAILQEAGISGNEVLVCRGTDFADSLSASASGKAIMLVGGTLNADQKAFMGGLKDKKFYIIGGVKAISSSLEDVIRTYGGTERISGANRYETSVKFAERFFENPKAAVLTYGLNFPDGLAGGVLAMSMDAPLLLTDSTAKNKAYAEKYAKDNNIVSGIVLGGTKLISEAAALSIFNAANK